QAGRGRGRPYRAEDAERALLVEGHRVGSPEGAGLGGETAEHLHDHRGLQTRSAVLPGPPVHFGGVVVSPAPPPGELVAEAVGVDAVADALGQALGLADGIGDPLAGGGVLEVPRIAHERPPRPGRLAEETLPPGRELGWTDRRRPLEHRGERRAGRQSLLEAVALTEAA